MLTWSWAWRFPGKATGTARPRRTRGAALESELANAHEILGVALGNKGEWDGEIAQEREALRLSPNYADAHLNLGVALGHKNDWDGEIAEEREALRLNPNYADAHLNLGLALGCRGLGRGDH